MSYSDLINIPYVDGCDDCYGGARKYYKKEYGLLLRNYARPVEFAHQGLNLITENLLREGFQYVDVSLNQLENGDGVIMSINRAPVANHIAVYVGNNFIFHHLYQRRSEKENFGPKWRARTLNIVRHPEVTRQNKAKVLPIINLADLMPPHVRARFPA